VAEGKAERVCCSDTEGTGKYFGQTNYQVSGSTRSTHTNIRQLVPRLGEIKRIARRGGTTRMSRMVNEEVRYVLRRFLERVIQDAMTYCGTRNSLFLSALTQFPGNRL